MTDVFALAIDEWSTDVDVLVTLHEEIR